MTGEDYRDLGTRYLAETERLAPGATHITDKMPVNFIFAGLIHLALPNATHHSHHPRSGRHLPILLFQIVYRGTKLIPTIWPSLAGIIGITKR